MNKFLRGSDITLEELLRMTVPVKDTYGIEVQIPPTFKIIVRTTYKEGLHIVLHPDSYNGTTLEFIVKDDKLIPLDNYPHICLN